MKRIIAGALFGVIGVAAMAQTCIVTNESLTTIDEHDAFAGELQNDSGFDILAHEYRVAFLDSNGTVLELQTVDGCLRSLQNGTSDFFSATSRLPADTTSIALARLANLAEDPDFKLGTVRQGDIALTGVTAERDGTTLTLAGTITNNDDDDLDDPVVCGVVWNDDDRVVTTGKDAPVAELEEGESAAFSIEIDVPNDSDLVDHVDVWADGLENGVPVEPESEEGINVAVATPTPTATPTP